MNPNRPAINWTPERLKIIREYYPTMFNAPLAKWIGCSTRTLERKAVELGLKKVEDFNIYRAEGISDLLSTAMKKAYADGRMVSPFRKGIRNNPDGEFKKGFRFTGDIEAARIDKIRRTYRKQKLLAIYGLSK